MRVLGLDPGSRRFGWGVVTRNGTRLDHVAHGVVDVASDVGLGTRLVAIESALLEVVSRHRPACASLESLFFAKDAQAAAKLGHARGVGLLVCARAQLPTFEYAPALVKRTVVGSGVAEKAQVAHMVRIFLGLVETPKPDAADALAVAITHVRQEPMRLAQARVPAPSQALAALLRGRGARGSTV